MQASSGAAEKFTNQSPALSGEVLTRLSTLSSLDLALCCFAPSLLLPLCLITWRSSHLLLLLAPLLPSPVQAREYSDSEEGSVHSVESNEG